MSDLNVPNDEPLLYTSAPVDGWVAVPAVNLEKADGYVLFVGTDQSKAWHFTIVNVAGTSDRTPICSKLCDAIAQFAYAHGGMRVSEIHFNESVADRLSLVSRYEIH